MVINITFNVKLLANFLMQKRNSIFWCLFQSYHGWEKFPEAVSRESNSWLFFISESHLSHNFKKIGHFKISVSLILLGCLCYTYTVIIFFFFWVTIKTFFISLKYVFFRKETFSGKLKDDIQIQNKIQTLLIKDIVGKSKPNF